MGQAPLLCNGGCQDVRTQDGAITELALLEYPPSIGNLQGCSCSDKQDRCNERPERERFVGADREKCLPVQPVSTPGSTGGSQVLEDTIMLVPPEDTATELVPAPAPHLGPGAEEEPRIEVDVDALLAAQRNPSVPSQARIGWEGALERSQLLTAHRGLRFADYYEMGNKAGEGSFGDVYQAWAKPWPSLSSSSACPSSPPGDLAGGSYGRSWMKRHVAVKIFQQACPTEIVTPRMRQDGAKKRASFDAERSMLATLEHPHIVRMYECFEESNTYYIVLELCSGGELYTRLVDNVKETGSGGFGEPLCRVFFKQMLFGLAYLHARRVVHRDIKTENFLLVGEAGSPEQDVVKLCDFGTSVLLTDRQPRSMQNVGTLSYTAPEVYANKGADVAADAWSLGVVLYILLTGANPFRWLGKGSRDDVVERIRTGNFDTRRKVWQQVASTGQDIVRLFLVVDEKQRLTCAQALQHCWVLGTGDNGGGLVSLDGAHCSSRLDGVPHGPVEIGATPDARVEPAFVAGHLAEHVSAVATLLLRSPRLAVAQSVALSACALAASEADLGPVVPWRELFLILDADQDGRLSFNELACGLRRLSQPQKIDVPDGKLEASIQAFDLDQNGFIEWTEWLAVALLGSPEAFRRPEPAGTAFRLLDRPLHQRKRGAAGDPVPPIMVGKLIRDWALHRKQAEDEFGGVCLKPLAEEADDGEAGLSAELPLTPRSFLVGDWQHVLTSLEGFGIL